MSLSILDLPDDILLEFCCRYLSVQDLCRLEQVCRQFYSLLNSYTSPWKRILVQLTNVSFSQLKNAIGCPTFENIYQKPPTISHPFRLPPEYQHEILFNRSGELPSILPIDYRRPSNQLVPCSKIDCDVRRLANDYRSLIPLAFRWNSENNYVNHTLIRFVHRTQTSLLQYDDHNHHLWFSKDGILRCLDLSTNQIQYSYEYEHDDILCYKVYDQHLIALANGNSLRIICRQTNYVHTCDNNQNIASADSKWNDILSLDVYSNDQERYLMINGSRDHSVSIRTFDMSSKVHQLIWSTRVDDRVLCSRFTNDGQHFLIGTGSRTNIYPLVLFNTERAQPIHVYDANYRVGAGVRCIEWVSPNVFIAAGFDSQFKEFDLRTGTCHYTFDDEFGNDYCSLAVSADQNGVSNGIVLGCNRHSTIRLVNRRQRQLQKVFFVSTQVSPVHSLAITPEYLFASLDRSIVALDFTKNNRHLSQVHYRF